MDLLLTSSGLSNESIKDAVRRLVNGPVRFAFIPTAANVEEGGKEWLIQDLVNCREVGSVDVVDISALPRDVWLPRLEAANVLVFGGGSTVHLMGWLDRSGLAEDLPLLLGTRLYVGISAGSIVTAKTLAASSEFLYYDSDADQGVPGLGLVDFHIRPHLNSPDFPKVRDEHLRDVARQLDGTLYALDDQSAVLVSEGDVDVISEGQWLRYA